MTTEFIKATPAEREVFTEEDRGYHKALKPRQIQMIAIGEQSVRVCFWARADVWPRLARHLCSFMPSVAFRISGVARPWRADHASPELRLLRLLCP